MPRPSPAQIAESPAVAAFERRIAASARPEAEVRDFLERLGPTPLIEETQSAHERIVTFIIEDAEATELLLFVNRITDERDLDASLMRRIPGTALWHLSYRMRTDWRASYSVVARRGEDPWPWPEGDQVRIRHALDRGAADPRNPHRMRNRAGTSMSVVALHDAPPQPWLGARGPVAPAGRVCEVPGPDGRRLWEYRSAVAGSGHGGAELAGAELAGVESVGAEPVGAEPMLIVLDGDAWIGSRGDGPECQDLTVTLDNLVADGEIPPLTAVFIDSVNRAERWNDLDDRGGQPAWIAERLLPWIASRRGEAGGVARALTPDRVVVIGQSLGGYTALRTVLEHPAAVGCAIAQSPSLWQRTLPPPPGLPSSVIPPAPDIPPSLSAPLAPSAPLPSALPETPAIFLEVGSQEWVLRDPCREFARNFLAAGANLRFVEYNGGHDYACWRGGVADGLRAILGGTRPLDRLGETIGDGGTR